MRIYEPTQEIPRQPDLLAMNAIKVSHLSDWYKRFKRGVAVNDGKYLTWFDDEGGERCAIVHIMTYQIGCLENM